ncbi:hypothetical protein C8R45DRAFT_1021150 [Mycena sanguinolenta]|nr:hypothetical protein C8R45DRAFT_1021150 [Mycena sanguinolenta]
MTRPTNTTCMHRSLTRTTIFRAALCPQALQVLNSQYLGLKVFWEPLKLRLGWVVTSRSTRSLVSLVQVTSVWSLLLGSLVVFLRLLGCSDVCGWEGNGVLPTLVLHVLTCLQVTSMVMVQAVCIQPASMLRQSRR